MPLVRLGRNKIAQLLVSTSTDAWNSTGAYFLVGNSTAAEGASSTWMHGANSTYHGMDATYPQRSTEQLTFQATFTTAEANFAWQEWGLWNATTTSAAAGVLLNRKLESPSLGTKTSAQSWQINAVVSVST